MDKTILIQQEENHNKFWVGEIKNNVVITRWGRIGVKGQSKDYPKGSSYAADNFLQSKINEKTRKGYNVVTEKKLKELCLIAACVGTQNKLNYEWVEKTSKGFKSVDEKRLQDPSCNPGLKIEFVTKDATYNVVITNDGCFTTSNIKIDESHPFWKYYQDVQESFKYIL